MEKEGIHWVRKKTQTHKLTTWKYLKWQMILKGLFTSRCGELKSEMTAIATKFLKEGLLLHLKVRLSWAVGPRERRWSSRWEGRTEWDWKEKKQLKMTQKPETKSEKSVFYRRWGCVSCFSNIKFLNLLQDLATFGQRCLGNYFLFGEKSVKGGKKGAVGGFVIPRCHFASSKFTNTTSDKQRGLI